MSGNQCADIIPKRGFALLCNSIEIIPAEMFIEPLIMAGKNKCHEPWCIFCEQSMRPWFLRAHRTVTTNIVKRVTLWLAASHRRPLKLPDDSGRRVYWIYVKSSRSRRSGAGFFFFSLFFFFCRLIENHPGAQVWRRRVARCIGVLCFLMVLHKGALGCVMTCRRCTHVLYGYGIRRFGELDAEGEGGRRARFCRVTFAAGGGTGWHCDRGERKNAEKTRSSSCSALRDADFVWRFYGPVARARLKSSARITRNNKNNNHIYIHKCVYLYI